MYESVSNEFKEIVKSNSITASAKLVFKDPNITLLGKAVEPLKSSLQELKITDNCYDKENGKLIGTVATKEVEITIINKDNLDLANKEFSLFPGVKLSNGTFEYVPYGNFIITDYKDMKHDNTFKLIAYDYMTKLNSKFSDNKVFKPIFPITLKQFKIQFLASYGLECEEQILPNDNFIIKAMPGFEGMSARAILGRIAELQGSFAKINRNNKVQFYLKTPTDRKKDTIKDGNTLSITDAIKSNTLEYNAEGNSRQETRQGYNLLQLTPTKGNMNGIDYEIKDDIVTLNGKATNITYVGISNKLIETQANNNYLFKEEYIAGKIILNNSFIRLELLDNKNSYKGYTVPLQEENTYRIKKVDINLALTNRQVRIDPGVELKNLKFKILFAKSDTDKPYEPYTGGQPMPSPDYPSEVECVNGYNLIGENYVFKGSQKINGITFTALGNGRFEAEGTFEQTKETQLSLTGEKIQLFEEGDYIFHNVKTYIKYINPLENIGWVTARESDVKKNFSKQWQTTNIFISVTGNAGETINTIIEPMIYKSTELKPYLPYGNMGIKDTGSNLYNKDKAYISGPNIILDTKLVKGEEYVFSTTPYQYTEVKQYDASNSLIKKDGSDNRTEVIFSVDQKAERIEFLFYSGVDNPNLKDIDFSKITLNRGKISLPYEPYKETIVPIDLKGNELCGIEETKDILNIDKNGKTTIDKKFAKYVFTGNENWQILSASKGKKRYRCYINNLIKPVESLNAKAKMASNFFKVITRNNTWNNVEGITTGLSQENKEIMIYIKKFENETTVDQFKQFLKDKYNSGNPVYVIYEMETPQTIQLEDTKVPLFEGVNNIELLSNIETNTSMMYNKRVPTENIDAMSMNSSLEIDNKYGGVNVVSLGMSNVEGENVTLKDDVSIQQMGKEVTIRIDDNPFVYTQELREQAIQELFNHLKGFSYVPTKFQYKARFYLDCGDQIQCEDVKSKQFVDSIVLNQYIKIPTSRQSKLENLALSDVAVKHKYISQTEQANSHTEILVDKANQKIEGVVSQIGDRSDKTTTITADLDKIFAQIQDKETLTNIVQGNKTLTLTNCHKGQLLELIVYGDNQSFLNNTTILGQSSILGKTILGWNSRIEVTYENGNKSIFDLGIKEVLRANGDIKDEYILKDGKAEIVRRINANGSIKATPIIESIGEREILLEEGKNILTILDYSPNIKATYVLKSEFSDLFTTNLEFNSEMKLTKNEFLVQLKEKVDNKDYTGAEIALKINQDKSKAVINADNIDINGVVSANGNFKVDKEGNMECNNGKFKGNVILDNGKKIIGGDGMLSNLQFFSQGQYFGFTLLGFNADYYGGESFEIHNADLTIDVLIPEDFEVESAFLVLQTTPAYWDGYDDKIQQDYKTWGNAKNLKLYKGTGNFEFILAYMSSWNAVLTNVGLIEIPNAFGGVSYTPTEKQGTSIEMKKTIDIKKYIDKGQYKLIVKSDLALPQNLTNSAINTGVAKASLNVFGYKKII